MSSVFNLYPTLSEEQIRSVVSAPASLLFSYLDNGTEQFLRLENKTDNEYGLIIHDGGESVVKIYYCPWCGSELSSENKAQNTITDCIGDCTGDGVPRP